MQQQTNNPPPPPYPTLPDIAPQLPASGMSEHLRHVSREAKNLRNRWSTGSPPGAGAMSAEEQHLLSQDAQDTPHSSPIPASRVGHLQSENYAPIHSSDQTAPSTVQLQKVINNTLLRERESKLLSTSTHPSSSSTSALVFTNTAAASSVAATRERQETVC
jgi:hypothetical protein